MIDGFPEVEEAGYVVRAARQTDGACERLDPHRAHALLRNNSTLVWINIIVSDTEAGSRYLIDELGFHRLAVEDALSDRERPTMQEFDDYVFFAIPSVEAGSQIETTEVGFFLLPTAMVTVTARRSSTVEVWFDRWCSHPKLIGQSSAMLCHAVVDGIVDAYFPVVDELEDRLDTLSDEIFNGDTTRVKDVLLLKRDLLDLRRRIVPIRDIVNQLLRNDVELIPLKTKVFFQDVYDHLMRIYDSLDVNRETVASLLDVHLSQVSNNLNIVVKKMTVFATVLMVMTLVTSIYGMNVSGLPFIQTPWTSLIVMLFLGALTIVGFKVAKWL